MSFVNLKAVVLLLISTAVLLTDSLPVSRRQAPPSSPPYTVPAVEIQEIFVDNPAARCIQLRASEEQELHCILERLEDDKEKARTTCDEPYNCGCSPRSSERQASLRNSSSRFATLFSHLVEDIHMYKVFGVASDYSETICRLEKMIKTQPLPNEYSLNDTIRDYCNCNTSDAACGTLLAPIQETVSSSSGQTEIDTLHDHGYCYLKEIYITMDNIIDEIEGVAGFNSSSCIRADRTQENILKEFKETVDETFDREFNRTHPIPCPEIEPRRNEFFPFLRLLQQPLLNSSNSPHFQNFSEILSEEILPILDTLLNRTSIDFRSGNVTLPELSSSQHDHCLLLFLKINYFHIYDDLKDIEDNLITEQCLSNDMQ